VKRKHAKKNRPPAPVSRTTTPPAAAPGSARWWWHLLAVLGLLAVNYGLYFHTLDVGFLSLDDPDYVQRNPYITSFSAANLKHIFTTPYFVNYAPAHLLSYTLDVALAGGRSAWAMHLSNLLWHGWVICMVYLLAFTVRAEIITATAAALLFALHPTHVEVVAWISSRKDLVATGFAALSMTCYLRCRRPGNRRPWWLAGSVLSFLLASAGKQSVILLPAVMLVWDCLVEKRRGWLMLADKIPFGLITIFFGWMTWHAQPGTNRTADLFVLASSQFQNLWLLTGLGDYVMYRPAPNSAAAGMGWRLALALAALLVWALPLLFVRRRQPVRAALCYWGLIQMVPPMTLSFIIPVTDRYLFLPSVGVCLLLAVIAADLTTRLPTLRVMPWLVLAGLSAVWGGKTWNYINEWRDPRSLWYFAAPKVKSSQACEYLGRVYQEAGDRIHQFVQAGKPTPDTNDLSLARAILREPARVGPLQDEWTGKSSTRTNSQAYCYQLWNLAWEQYEQAVACRGTVSAPNLFMGRGMILTSQGKFTAAIQEFQIALQFAQKLNYENARYEYSINALRGIGVAHWNMRDYKSAQQWLLQAQQLQQQSGKAWVPTLDQEVERIGRRAAGLP